MAVLTVLARLEAVQAAIAAAYKMQSYRLGDRTVTRADLAALLAEEKALLREYNREQGTKPTVIGTDFEGMGYSAT